MTDALLARLAADPCDREARAVYLDWLSEHDPEPRKAELLRLNWQLADRERWASEGELEQERELARGLDAAWLRATTIPRWREVDDGVLDPHLELSRLGSPIEIVRAPLGHGVLWDGVPLALLWVGDRITRAGSRPPLCEALRALLGDGSDGWPNTDDPVAWRATAFDRVHRLLPSDRYYVPTRSFDVEIRWPRDARPADEESTTLFATCPRDGLDAAAVARWREQIAAGKRPWALALTVGEGHEASVVIEGHHKLAAYQAEGRNPSVVIVEAYGETCDRIDDPAAFFPSTNELLRYRDEVAARGDDWP